MSSVRKLLSDTMIYGLSTIIARVLNFLLTPIFTHKFPTAVYGVFTNLYAYAAMINAVLALGMETTYFRYLQRVEKEDRSKIFNNSFLITLVTSTLFILTLFIFINPIAAWLGEGKQVADAAEYVSYVKYFGVILAADALAVIPFVKLRAEGRPLVYGAIKLINIFVLVLSNCFLLFWLPALVKDSSFWQQFASGWFHEGWLGNVFISNLIASIVTLLLLLPQLRAFKFAPDKALIRSMLAYSLPILIANVSYIINEHLDKMMFPRLLPGELGDRDLGIYGAVAKLAIFLNLFITAFRLGVEPFFFSHAKHENARKTYASIMDYFIIAMVVVMVGICANLDWLKYFIKGGDKESLGYWSGLYIVPILLFNNVLLGIYMNLSVWYKLSDQTRYALYISGIGAVLTIILNIVFIPHYSFLGAVLSTTLAYSIMVILSYVWGQKNYPIPYHTRSNLFYLFGGAGLSALIFYGLDSTVWISNGLFLLFILFIVRKEKNKVLALLRKK
ncbi:polysaccharide biosynthesis C-terminal domain-containing protein [Sphingobacterium sp. Mn56C]|uniref:oligosaccharide flippase family protein n=1 Tax=Sphingobacterium sp. Mn56C TaxID=3395261 RepID=UPI003BCF4E54